MTMLINPYAFGTTGGGGGFTPNDLDNRLGWYDYTDMTPGSEGSGIDEVTDRWGGFAPNATSGDRPTWNLAEINGLNVADYTGEVWHFASTSELNTGNGAPSGTPISAWIVFESTTPTPIGTSDRYVFDMDSGALRYRDGDFDLNTTDIVAYSTGWHRAIIVWQTDNTADVRFDGTDYTGLSATISPTEIILGRQRSTSSNRMAGRIAEFGWVDDALTSQEISDLDDYLADKYGL